MLFFFRGGGVLTDLSTGKCRSQKNQLILFFLCELGPFLPKDPAPRQKKQFFQSCAKSKIMNYFNLKNLSKAENFLKTNQTTLQKTLSEKSRDQGYSS